VTLDLSFDAAIFLGDFDEPGVQFRVSQSSDARDVDAIVLRNPAQDDQDSPYSGTRQSPIQVRVANSTSNGINPSEINIDESQLLVSAVEGGTARWRTIKKILGQDSGMTLLEVMS